MKKNKIKVLIWLPVIAGSFVLFTAFGTFSTNQSGKAGPEDGFVIPDDVNEILNNKCFDCHNVNAEGEKAKKKLLLDKLPELSKAKLISKLDGIAETMKEGEMPPEKFLTKYPEYTPTREEAQLLIDWANSAADELLK